MLVVLSSAVGLHQRFSRRPISNRKGKHLSNQSYLSQTLALQNRSLHVERDKLRVQKEKVQVLKTISTELSALRALYTAVHGIEIIMPANTEE